MESKKICLLYPGTTTAAWSCSDGIVTTLRKMGYKVLEFPRGRADSPKITLEAINKADLFLISGLEHLLRVPPLMFLEELFDIKDFKMDSNLTPLERVVQIWEREIKVPVAVYYHESFVRPDYTMDFTAMRPFGQEHFFPAVQDAETFDEEHFGAHGHCHWLPFGVDTDVFRPMPCFSCSGRGFKLLTNDQCDKCLGSGQADPVKTADIAFIGLMYGPRQQFLQRLQPHLKDVAIIAGGVQLRDLPDIAYADGIPWEEMARRLASNYRKCKVFFNLPSLSQHLVTKVFEVMACGTFLVTPALEGSAQKNMELFTHNKHLIYYKELNHAFTNQILREFLAREKDREAIAMAGMHEVRTKHSLKQRLEQILETCLGKETQPDAAGTPPVGDGVPSDPQPPMREADVAESG